MFKKGENKIEEIEYEDFVKVNSGVLYTSIPKWKAKNITLEEDDLIKVKIIKIGGKKK